MARVVFAALLVFLFIQLAASVSFECYEASQILTANTDRCLNYNDPSVLCTGDCRTYYENVIKYCYDGVYDEVTHSYNYLRSYVDVAGYSLLYLLKGNFS